MEHETRNTWLKIARVDTKGRILDFTDPNPEGVDEGKYAPKIRMNLCCYGEDNKATLTHAHSIDCDTLGLLMWDILTQRKGTPDNDGKYSPILSEFKGTVKADGIVSRRLTVTYNDTLKMGPVYQFRFQTSEGMEGRNGQVTPKQGAPTIIDETMNVAVQEARTVALVVLHHLQAKATARLLRY